MKRKETVKDGISKAIDVLIDSGVELSTLFDQDGLLKQLSKRLVEKALASEMDNHLDYNKYAGSDSDNARNDLSSKQIITDNGVISVEVPRDRSSTFEPVLLPKRQTRIPGLDNKILSLYAKGMSLSDIQIQIQELYGAEVSESLISNITDAVIKDVKIWQNRPLESVYPIVFFDCFVVKVRQDKRISNKSVYVALGIDRLGMQDVLGLWMSENAGAKFWLGNLTELKNRGMHDILIACTDNLPGMSEAITAVHPKTEHQLCIVHAIRNSLQYVSYKHRKALVADLKPVYTAVTEEEALMALEAFATKWNQQYPQIAKSWYANWDNLMVFLQYPSAIRRVIYTTNAVESVNSQFRRVTKNKRVFPNDLAVFKTLYLTINYMTRKWTIPIHNWSEAMAHFLIKLENRI
ncbi:IS256 family transposase [Cardinium endosymbiont of Oedothorax gibbosus]|uniref:IS256 family transposase n=1 Tax=Cardinium endosymbiont of Oedothorax gibbosus TaxID=931101 RepID=UPI0020256706|nr:IS256 family transposase [Cardinium endosymbiont of Oedothorax gibbosus]CAH2559827.1 Transposase ISCca9, IS256 family [Cardinium endosymbiont of Oedothorax gibbosus]